MKFYVYTYSYPDGKVFYVGKGTRNRMLLHESLAKSNYPGPTYDVIRQILANNKKPIKNIIFETDDEIEAFKYEVQQINFYGLSNLTNKNSGGGGGRAVKNKPITTMKINTNTLENLRNIHNVTGESLQNILERLVKKGMRKIVLIPPSDISF